MVNSSSVITAGKSVKVSPNPASDKLNITLTGYSGNVEIQLSSIDGRILQHQKIRVDEKGNRQTEKLVIAR